MLDSPTGGESGNFSRYLALLCGLYWTQWHMQNSSKPRKTNTVLTGKLELQSQLQNPVFTVLARGFSGILCVI